MSTTVDEIGTIAAESVSTILTAGPDRAWRKLVDGGWALLSADAEADLSLRDLQEVARTVGRHDFATPLLTTLLAGRWFAVPEDRLAAGVTVAVPQTTGALVPYAVEGVVVLDGQGSPLDANMVAGSSRDSFSGVMPVIAVDGAVARLGDEQVNELRATLAAVAAGCADAVLERSVAWAQTREQFGRTIASFQAVRHHLADMHIAREQTWTAAVAAGQETDAAAMWSRIACDLSTTCIELGIQVHGGVGFTAEVGLHHYLDHVMQIRTVLGALAGATEAAA